MGARAARRDGGPRVVVVGGGFAGLGCTAVLAERRGVHVTLVDRQAHHVFQPLLYQVATAQLSGDDVAYPLRDAFDDEERVTVVRAEVTAVDPAARTATTADGTAFTGDALVLAAGARVRFMGVPGAEDHALPMYTLPDARAVRERIIGLFDAAAADPDRIADGDLTVVVVGAGATGTETAGAVAEMIAGPLRAAHPDLDASLGRVVVVDHAPVVLKPFSEGAHAYAAEVLTGLGVELRLGAAVDEVGPGHVTVSGERIPTRCVVWAAGTAPAPLAGLDGLPRGRGGRVDVRPDLTVAGLPGVYVLGDLANIPGVDGAPLPQLGAVALQSGRWAARNILAAHAGRPQRGFRYRDKGIMAMIGRNAAVAEVGPRRRALRGRPAFLMWLGVHLALMEGRRNRADAFADWAREYFSPDAPAPVLDRLERSRMRRDAAAPAQEPPG